MIVNPSKGCPTMSKHPRMLEGSPLNIYVFILIQKIAVDRVAGE